MPSVQILAGLRAASDPPSDEVGGVFLLGASEIGARIAHRPAK